MSSVMFNQQYGPWALIAGGSDGVGAAFAREVASRGVNLVLIGRRLGPLDDMSSELRSAHSGLQVRTVPADLGDDNAIEKIKADTAELEIGCLIYNAGSETAYGDFLEHGWGFLRARLQRNFITEAALIHHFGRAMRLRRRGGIILMGSIAGLTGSPGFALYSASKAFVHNLAEGLWHEFKKDNVHLLCPIVGTVNTPTMVDAYGPLKGPASEPSFVARGAIERIGQGPLWIAQDIAAGVQALSAMAPAERSDYMAKSCAEFAGKS